MGSRTCFTSMGTFMAGTFFSIYLSSEATSMGWRTTPAMLAMRMHHFEMLAGPAVVWSDSGPKVSRGNSGAYLI